MSKVSAREGRTGFFKELEVLTSATQSFTGGWGIITAKGASSHFDTVVDDSIEGGEALEVGMPVYIPAFTSAGDNPLSEGDEVQAMEASTSCWTTDANYSPSEGTVEVTSQCDVIEGKRDIRADGQISESGTVSGYYEDKSEMIKVMSAFFAPVIHDADGKLTFVKTPVDKTLWTFFILRETDTVGEIETTIIRKQLISGVTISNQTTGYIPFNYSYTTLESYEYRRKVSA